MHNVKVKRDELLTRVKTNRDAHRDEFLKAQEGYRERVIEELDRMLAEARTGGRVRRAVQLVEPQDHTSDYDRVIDMLEMSQDEIIEIDATSFQQFVRDEWTWAAQAKLINSTYSSGGAISQR